MPGKSLARKLIERNLAPGTSKDDGELDLSVEQVLIHDASGPMVVLELEAMGLDRVRVPVAVGYVDHLVLQDTHRSADDHAFFRSACERFGLWYSRPGNGICHALHQARFGRPGAVLIGADSHTCALGAIGMLAIGAGGIDVAMVLAGQPYPMPAPRIWGVRLTGRLPAWVGAKDVILEMLRRHGLSAGRNRIVEYFGPGLDDLDVMDRHVIASMGAELGATATVFPADETVRAYLEAEGRGAAFAPLAADPDAIYDDTDEIDLSALEPLIALPSSPANVVPVRTVTGAPVHQVYVGSSGNPGYRDLAVVAAALDGRQGAEGVSIDINPATVTVLRQLSASGALGQLLAAGARLHQTGCNGCIGLGQVPSPGRASLRTVPRNFPGRSGTADDRVFLCGPETAAASALAGQIADPRSLGPAPALPDPPQVSPPVFAAPLPPERAAQVQLVRSLVMKAIPVLPPLPDALDLPVLLVIGDDLSTDDILPAGSSMTRWTDFDYMVGLSFGRVDQSYPERARSMPGGHAIVAGRNYGQGSSREHAALAPRWLGLRAVLAREFARIHLANLANAGILPLAFARPEDRDRIDCGDRLRLTGLVAALRDGAPITAVNVTTGAAIAVRHDLSPRQRQMVLSGGAVELMRARLGVDFAAEAH